MNTFIVLLEHECDATKLEQLMNENTMIFECDVIGIDILIFEFIVHTKYVNIVNLLLKYNNIIELEFFKSN